MLSITQLKKELIEIGKELGFEGERLVKYVEEESEKETKRIRCEKEKEDEKREKEKEREKEIERERQDKERTERLNQELAIKELELKTNSAIRIKELEIEESIQKEKTKQASYGQDYATTIVTPSYTGSPGCAPDPMGFHLDVFQEKLEGIDQFLERFQSLAEVNNLDPTKWALKLSLSLRGRAYEVYARLSPEERNNFDEVKRALLKQFEVSSENYRKKFRNTRKERHETFKQFGNRLDLYLTQWVKMSDTEQTYEGLSQLMVMDQLREIMPSDTRRFVDEQGAKSLSEAIELADRFQEAQEISGRRQTTGQGPHNPNPVHPRPSPNHQRSLFKGQTENAKPSKTDRSHNRNKNFAAGRTRVKTDQKSQTTQTFGYPPVIQEIVVNGKRVKALYDSGLNYHAVVAARLVQPNQYTGEKIRLQCATLDQEPLEMEIANIEIDCPYVVGIVPAAVVENPIQEIIIGCKYVFLGTPSIPIRAGAMTTRKQAQEEEIHQAKDNPAPTEMKKAQSEDKTLKGCFAKLNKAHCPPGKGDFVMKEGLIYRVVNEDQLQLVIPSKYRSQILEMGHAIAFSGHTGSGATMQRISTHYFWPGICEDVKRYVRSCPICQRKSARTYTVPVTLGEMPITGTAFERVAVDIVGPLPLTKKKNRFILTLVDTCTMWGEAVPLSRIDSRTVADALITIFTRLGFPQQILTDNGSNFCGKLMKEVYELLRLQHIRTSVYHPQSNGQVERFNGTLIAILKKLVENKPETWDTYIAPALYAYRDVPHGSTGMAPATLLFGRPIAGPLEALKRNWTEKGIDDTERNASKYVEELKDRLSTSWTVAANALRKARKKQAQYYNRRAKDRELEIGDQVLLLLPRGNNKLEIEWQGPYPVVEKVSRTNYKVKNGGKIKTYHINLLKKYVVRTEMNTLMGMAVAEEVESTAELALEYPLHGTETYKDVLISDHLKSDQTDQIKGMLARNKSILTDKPGLTHLVEAEFSLMDHTPIRCKPYPVPEAKEEIIEKEVTLMLEAGIITRSKSDYSAPIVLLRKPNGEHRLCIDFRKLNTVIYFQADPLPNQEKLFSRLSKAKYFSKIDLSKGYYQISVPQQLRRYLAFTANGQLYEFTRLPFGLHIAPAIFSRMMSELLRPLENDNIIHFLDDCLISTGTWDDHVRALTQLFDRLKETNLTARPTKCEIGFPELTFLGHHLQEGVRKPDLKNLEKMKDAPRPLNKKDVRSFLGMCGFYQKYIPKFNIIAAPLSELTKKAAPEKVIWTSVCEQAFQTLKDKLVAQPILQLPNPKKTYILRTDASHIGIAATLLQSSGEEEPILCPVAYASRKLSTAEKNYSTVEQECLALVWGIQKFQFYLYGRHFVIQSDNQPMLYLATASQMNAKLMRWSLLLQQYSFHVEHIKGSENHFSDFLSRHPVEVETD